MTLYTDDELLAANDAGMEWDHNRHDERTRAEAILDAVAPAIAARAKAEAWDEAAEAVADWMCNNPSPSGIPADPPRNPYADEIEAAS